MEVLKLVYDGADMFVIVDGVKVAKARDKHKLRREFKHIGREGVRDKIQSGDYGMGSRRGFALGWLRDQEAGTIGSSVGLSMPLLSPLPSR